MDDEPPPLTVVRPGEGRTADLGDGVGVAFKLWGADTGASLAVVEHPFAVGAYVSAHLHTREDEYSIVVEAVPADFLGEVLLALRLLVRAWRPSRARTGPRSGPVPARMITWRRRSRRSPTSAASWPRSCRA
ncbi:hypothetical protein QOZ88_00690 [Blastococcus sp. BMG 814]|uniref:Uncharacterized protein n=1 Tax=Blastococcus carthaginiensis TaxID=3050034 RepID=A0ABT9I6E6_9ACTN|nr:hypothetical protein [Blastococcus carthaginiensis]MDP5181144.1 hypothetical protein [Blastococcus carthaginiensis]